MTIDNDNCYGILSVVNYENLFREDSISHDSESASDDEWRKPTKKHVLHTRDWLNDCRLLLEIT